MDTLSNSVLELEFGELAPELIVTCRLRAEHFGLKAIIDSPLNQRAIKITVQYTAT